jgi:rod shape-determining protein MreD
MYLTIAAVIAVVAALAEFTVVPYLHVADAVPHPVLVFGVITVIAAGLEVGLAWAFIGGIALDILGQRPLGSSAFALLIAIAAASLLGGFLSRVRILAPVAATLLASPIYLMLLLLATTALTTTPLSGVALESVLPDALYDTVLAAIAGPLVIAIAARRREPERVDW